MSHSTHADQTQARVDFLDGKNQLQELDVLKAAVVFANALVDVRMSLRSLRGRSLNQRHR
jgi:hypothetical protein